MAFDEVVPHRHISQLTWAFLSRFPTPPILEFWSILDILKWSSALCFEWKTVELLRCLMTITNKVRCFPALFVALREDSMFDEFKYAPVSHREGIHSESLKDSLRATMAEDYISQEHMISRFCDFPFGFMIRWATCFLKDHYITTRLEVYINVGVLLPWVATPVGFVEGLDINFGIRSHLYHLPSVSQ